MEKHPQSAFFGIFDGHSGALCSKYISENLHKRIDDIENFSDRETLRFTVMDTDNQFLESAEFRNKDDGSAGIFSIVTFNPESHSYVCLNGNVGDSRTVLARKKEDASDSYVAIACTHDHKPTDEKEKKRIEAAGGFVQLSRVDAQLALSRAFGDRMLKTPLTGPPAARKVCSDPDFTEEKLNKDDFLFMACDGIYESDVFTRQSVIDFIGQKLAETDDIAQICADVLEECLTRGSRDNMSCMIIQCKDGRDYNSEHHEYIPGPWHNEETDQKFQEAYVADAKAAGYTLNEAKELRKKIEDKQQAAGKSPESEV